MGYPFLTKSIAFVCTFVAALSSHLSYADQPNIIVIYTDDQGYGDVSFMNPKAKFSTPNMDRLAKEGIVFTDGHSCDAVCTPSRYGLLTGRYCWRTIKKKGVLGAEAKCLIKDGQMTLPTLLKSKGYNTAMVGKWHLGMDFPGTRKNRDWTKPVKDMPLDKGFDYYFGVPASLNYGVLAWFEGRHAAVPPTLFTNKKPNKRHMDYRMMPPYQKTPDETKKALGKVGLEVAPDFIDNQCLTKFTDKAIQWMESKTNDAKNGKPFFLYLPFTSPHYPVCPLPEFWGKGKAGGYGEFVIETDYHIGRVLKFLKESELDDNTMIVFTSDNGPERSWQQRITEFDHDSRGGLREGKRSIYEGGHRVPFLIRWPNGIKQPGRSWNHQVGQIDLLATFAELVETPLSDEAGPDSQSFASVFQDPESTHRRLPLINHSISGRFSITESNWKLVLPHGQLKAELYDLSKDLVEKTNLIEQHPDVAAKLKQKATQIVCTGRTTKGAKQKNDTGYWEDLKWIEKAEFRSLTNED